MMTAGRRSLIAVLQRTSAREVALRCHVPRQRVSDWSTGVRIPTKAARDLLASVYGIASESWRTPIAARPASIRA